MNECALYAEIDAWVDRRFEWGRSDCVLFAFACLDAAHGTRLYDAWAGRWHDRKSAEQYVARHDLRRVLSDAGFERVKPQYYQAGDVLITGDSIINALPSPAVCLGRNLAGMTIRGLVIGRVEDHDILEVWSCRPR